MITTLFIALRNVLRNRRRTLVTLITLAIGEIALLIFGGYSNAVVHGVETGVIRQAGHLQVQRKNYFLLGAGSPVDYSIADYESLVQLIRNDPDIGPHLRVITPLLQVQGIAGNFSDNMTRTVNGYGYIPRDQNVMRHWNEYGFPDNPRNVPLPEDDKDSMSLGVGVARALNLCSKLKVPNCQDIPRKQKQGGATAPSDIVDLAESTQTPSDRRPGVRLDFLAASASGAPKVINARVVAAESLGVKEIDDSYLAMPLEMAQALVYGRDSKPQATSIILQLDSMKDLEPVRKRLQTLISERNLDLEVLDYATLFPAYGQIKGLFYSIFGFVSTLIGVVVLFSVANTMGTSVIERTVEIGTIRSMGVRWLGIARQFLAEGFLIGAIGTLSGCVIALLLALAINSAGLTWTPPNSIDKIPLVVHVFNSPLMVISSVLVLLMLSILSSVVPAWRAARIPVVEALRHV